MNTRSAIAIFTNELTRFFRTAFGSILSPVLTTSLYFIVFGAAIGGRIPQIGGVPYGAFIVPGLLMLTLLGETTSNASFGIYMPRFTGAIYELLSAPVGVLETLVGFVGAAVLKSLIIAGIILLTALLFVDYRIVHPLYALGYVMLVASVMSPADAATLASAAVPSSQGWLQTRWSLAPTVVNPRSRASAT